MPIQTTLLQESTLKDICDELCKRNLSFLMIAKYYDGSPDEQFPFVSFGARREDIPALIGIQTIAQKRLVDKFSQIIDIDNEEE